MTREKLFLYFVSAFYLLFALAYIIFPAALTEPMGLTAGPSGLIEIRAVYGGFQLGLAIFLFWSTWQEERIYPGLLITVLTTGGIALVRLVSMLITMEIGNHWIGLAIELVVTLVGGYLALRRQ